MKLETGLHLSYECNSLVQFVFVSYSLKCYLFFDKVHSSKERFYSKKNKNSYVLKNFIFFDKKKKGEVISVIFKNIEIILESLIFS